MGIVGCYSMDLYCDHPEHCKYSGDVWPFPSVYSGRSESECLRNAKKDGWKIDKKKDGERGMGSWFCLCPAHTKKNRK